MTLFFLALGVLVWVASIWVIQWRRFRELFQYGLWGALVAGFEDRLGKLYGLWHYVDYGPVRSHEGVAMIISLSAAPLFAMAYVQGLRPHSPIPWGRLVLYTAVSLIPEILSLQTGHMVYGPRWSIWTSMVAYLPTWLSLWALHRWQTAVTVEQGGTFT